MLGAIAGDIIGSIYENNNIKTKDFPLFRFGCDFTDDTVLTVAVAKAILKKQDYAAAIRDLARQYPNAGYGFSFSQWMQEDEAGPYGSWGNGSAMRVSPVGFAFESVDQVLAEARRTAMITHDHSEGIKGAQATALAVYLARTTHDKTLIRREITQRFGYNLERSLEAIRPDYEFDVSCQGTVPEAVIAFLESTSFEDAVRNAVSLGGDADTLACITGGIAHAYYGSIPARITTQVRKLLTEDLWQVTETFCRQYGIAYSE